MKKGVDFIILELNKDKEKKEKEYFKEGEKINKRREILYPKGLWNHENKIEWEKILCLERDNELLRKEIEKIDSAIYLVNKIIKGL